MTGTLALPGGPLGVAVNPKSGVVYVADWYGSRIFVVSADGSKIETEIQVGASPSGIAVTPDGATILVANREGNSVSLVDAATATETVKIPVGEHPFGITLDETGTRAYTANVMSNDVSVIDVAGRREFGRVTTGERPYVVALTATRGFVTDQYSNTVTVFNLKTLTNVAAIEVGDHPEGIAASRDGSRLYVTNWGSNTLGVIDATTLKVIKDIPGAGRPTLVRGLFAVARASERAVLWHSHTCFFRQNASLSPLWERLGVGVAPPASEGSGSPNHPHLQLLPTSSMDLGQARDPLGRRAGQCIPRDGRTSRQAARETDTRPPYDTSDTAPLPCRSIRPSSSSSSSVVWTMRTLRPAARARSSVPMGVGLR